MIAAPTPVDRRRAASRHRWALVAAAALGVVAGVLVAQGAFEPSSGSQTRVGSGVPAAQYRQVPPFSRVELAGTNNVTVRVGAARGVVVRADENLLDRVTTGVRAGKLTIGDLGSFTARSPMTVEIGTPSLEAVALTGDGIVSVSGAGGRRFSAQLTGTGLVQVSGAVDRLDARLDGTGNLELGDLPARDVEAVVHGTGRVIVRPSRTLDASVPGTGSIVYRGHPAKVTTNITGSGAVVRE
jgi:hypothetical protein